MNEHEIKNVFAKNLNNLIRDSGKSRAEVAEAIGVTTSAVGAWCIGKKSPRMDKVDKLAALFNVSRSALLEENSLAPKKDTREWLEDLLVERGWITRGQDLTDAQTEFLIHLVGLIDAFGKMQNEH